MGWIYHPSELESRHRDVMSSEDQPLVSFNLQTRWQRADEGFEKPQGKSFHLQLSCATHCEVPRYSFSSQCSSDHHMLPSAHAHSFLLSVIHPPSHMDVPLIPLFAMNDCSLCHWPGEATEARCPPLETQDFSASFQLTLTVLYSNSVSTVKSSTLPFD